MPPEYCEFSTNWPRCSRWLLSNCPFVHKIYPDLSADKLADDVANVELTSAGDGEGGGSASGAADGKPASKSQAERNDEGKEGDIIKKLPGGKVVKKAPRQLIIERAVRRRKDVTAVRGLELYGVKLKEAAKLLGKKFACGASVTKDAHLREQIELQGDYTIQLTTYLLATYPALVRDEIYWQDPKEKPRKMDMSEAEE